MNSALIPALLYKLNENQLALEAAIMELTLWIELQGSSVAQIARSYRLVIA